MERVGDKCFVTQVRPDTDAAIELHVGDQVATLDGFNIARPESNNMRYFFQILSPHLPKNLAS